MKFLLTISFLFSVGYGQFTSHRGRLNSSIDNATHTLKEAEGVTDATTIKKVDKFIKTFKSYNIWDKYYVVYFFIGSGTLNAKNPYDDDLAFRLTLTGSPTVSNGITFNGTSQIANTHFIGIADGLSDMTGMSWAFAAGAGTPVDDYVCGSYPKSFCLFTGSAVSYSVGQASFVSYSSSPTYEGIHIFNRNAESGSIRYLKDGSLLHNSSQAFIHFGENDFKIGGVTDGGTTVYAPITFKIFLIGEGVTTTQETIVKNAIYDYTH